MKGRGVESNPKSWSTGKETAALLAIAVGSTVSNDDSLSDNCGQEGAVGGCSFKLASGNMIVGGKGMKVRTKVRWNYHGCRTTDICLQQHHKTLEMNEWVECENCGKDRFEPDHPADLPYKCEDTLGEGGCDAPQDLAWMDKKAFSGALPTLSESECGQEKYVEDSQRFLIFKLKGLKVPSQIVCEDCLHLSDNLYADRVISIEERVEYIRQVFTHILTFVSFHDEDQRQVLQKLINEAKTLLEMYKCGWYIEEEINWKSLGVGQEAVALSATRAVGPASTTAKDPVSDQGAHVDLLPAKRKWGAVSANSGHAGDSQHDRPKGIEPKIAPSSVSCVDANRPQSSVGSTPSSPLLDATRPAQGFMPLPSDHDGSCIDDDPVDLTGDSDDNEPILPGPSAKADQVVDLTGDVDD
mmetsp:Transcript_74596/g.121206  ORF Transcript_74596/g.121206 Transcript_74596/m.121206 type:complete len:412 (-) Transcript_74596:391-1626(-)|eukprot:CAMPEP_0179414252 /NCGR_PEP_ID=MMETSP0799-20121207/5558_1 /TAXON_ID=46947 /ORGANISM="Geminigera cryophila, Strain CCMP2564" /LENGTH=411 /DNA_ID=CAMNT_0021186829 /DNA_START=786 /DNA_END=2021 /DNA_ORIENTATION=-